MDGFTLSVLTGAVGIALLHTAIGPDHYLPFVMLGRARRWSLRRTLVVTALCGVGHVLSSLLLGGVGVAAGMAIGWVEDVEGGRGDLAAWALFSVGVAYALWGIRHARRRRVGLELHRHGEVVHLHQHGGHGHLHDHARRGEGTTFWTLFIVFVLGPCEPLIPLFVLPASEGRWGTAIAAGAVFGVVTVATMIAITGLMIAGAARLPLGPLERWSHALAGGVIATSAGAVLFLGL